MKNSIFQYGSTHSMGYPHVINLFYNENNTLPCTTHIGELSIEVKEQFKKEIVWFETSDCIVRINNDIFLRICERDSKICYVSIFHTLGEDLELLKASLEFFKIVSPTENKSEINMISKGQIGYNLVNYKFPTPVIDLDINYGKGFEEKHNFILGELNKKDSKGLFLFHSEPGCGKTNYIKLLLSKITKKVIYLPPHMVDILVDPSFITFLSSNKGTVLVIEDAERVLMSREDSYVSSSAISTLLNLTDGILSDCLSIQVVCTFNTSEDKIDKALLRKGRLIMSHKFGKLSIEESQILADKLNKNIKIENSSTLAELFNIEAVNTTISKPERKSIGFSFAK